MCTPCDARPRLTGDMNKKEQKTIEDLKRTIAALQLENGKLKEQVENKEYIISVLQDQFVELQGKWMDGRVINISNSTVTIGK
jgi:hypothetical protein